MIIEQNPNSIMKNKLQWFYGQIRGQRDKRERDSKMRIYFTICKRRILIKIPIFLNGRL